MNPFQKKLNSEFNFRSTAEDVLRGVDLSGNLAIVTGGYSGLGLETTRSLAQAGAHVIVLARQPSIAKEVLSGIASVEVDALDLADLGSVHRFSQRFLSSQRSIDMLINNAGIMACPETRVGQGWEAQFAINHLGHYVLTNLLWPAFSGRGARIISVSSAGHHLSGIRWDDPHFTRGYDKWLAYGQAKTANILFAVQCDKYGRDRGVRAFALHPGKILTPLQRHLQKEEMIAAGWIDKAGNLADSTFKTVQQGAATQVWAATSQQLNGLGGLYCEDCDIAVRATNGTDTLVGVRDYALNPQDALRLWDLSAKLTGINTFELS
ncbi:MAG: SDR family NAD(P)-dependent oxidoreductase [Verrucomicrobiota bacterium JB023]|nr:SDR family NAD(P)-dependent oxidoreductase [Verrucomicrobiota bacterium JB023]